MIVGVTLMDNLDNSQFINGVKHLDKKRQVELLRSLLQQLEPDVVQEAAEDVVINVGNNNNHSNITYADVVLNLYCNDDLKVLTNLLDAAAYRLRNKEKPHPVE